MVLLVPNRYFISYEALKKKLTPEGTPASTLSILTAGGLAGIAMWSIAIPADTIKVSDDTITLLDDAG